MYKEEAFSKAAKNDIYQMIENIKIAFEEMFWLEEHFRFRWSTSGEIILILVKSWSSVGLVLV